MPVYKQNKKKDGKWQYRVVVNYTDKNGNYCKKTKMVYGAAEAAECEGRMQVQLSIGMSKDSMTINQLFADYIEAKKHETRDTSYEKSIRILKRYILPVFGKTKLKNLTPPVLQKWKNSVNEIISEKTGNPLALNTKNNIYTEFSTMLNFAVKMEFIPKTPLAAIGRFKEVDDFSKPQDTLHYYTEEQFNAFINFAYTQCNSHTAWGFYVFFLIAFFTGMRKGEINALKWSDIDDNIIHVRRSVSQKVKGKPLVETSPKNKASYRNLKASSQLVAVLQEHKKRQMQESTFTDDFRVCGGIACLSDTSISNFNCKCAKGANLPHIRIHDFRHTHASYLINKEGIRIEEIARRLGHSNIKTTWNTYAHLYPEEEDRAVDCLEKVQLTCLQTLI